MSAYFIGLFETSPSPRATASKQTMQNVGDCWILFDKPEQVCGLLLKGTSYYMLFQAFNWSKDNLSGIHISQGLDWTFSSLSHYFLMLELFSTPFFLTHPKPTHPSTRFLSHSLPVFQESCTAAISREKSLLSTGGGFANNTGGKYLIWEK